MRLVAAALALSACLGALGCAAISGVPWVWVEDFSARAAPQQAHRLQVGDRVSVLVWNQPQLSGEQVVRRDGLITVALMGDLSVVGLTTSQAAAGINQGLDGLVREPNTTVALIAPRQAVVFVVGEVNAPGEFPLTRDEGVLELLARAGGLTEFADEDKIFVIRRTPEKQTRVRFSYDRLRKGSEAATRFKLVDGDVLVIE